MDFYKSIIAKLQQEYEPNPHVFALFVTGSVARGEAHAGNDLDILLVNDGSFTTTEYRIANALVEIGAVRYPDGLQALQQNPMQLYMYLDAVAVFDKQNYLLEFQKMAQHLLETYTPPIEDIKAERKWLSSVVDKLTVAHANGDTEKRAFLAATTIWQVVEGLYMVNSLPTPASTSALRKIHQLPNLPTNFAAIWQHLLFGTLDERVDNLLTLCKFILLRLDNLVTP